jgi:hypothetical protein
MGRFRWRCGYRFCRGCKGAAGPKHAKTSLQGRRKQFLGKFSAAPAAMVKIPASLRMRPAWWELDRLGGPAVTHGAVGCQAWCPQPCTP